MSLTWKVVLGIIATVVMAIGLLVTALPFLFPTAPINTGDAVYSSADASADRKECTIGYSSKDFALTAGHCVKDGQDAFNEDGDSIGLASRSFDRDIAVIYRNPYVPNTGAYPAGNDVKVGDSVCMTSRVDGTRSCGEVMRIDSFRAEVTPALHGMAGDSGAGIIKNDEVVGVYTGNVKSETDDVLYSTFSLAP